MKLRRIAPTDNDYQDRLRELCRRSASADEPAEAAARAIVEAVRRRGDDAVREYTVQLDRRAPGPDGTYEVDAERRRRAVAEVAPDVRASLERAAARIRAFHAPQMERGYAVEDGRAELAVVPLSRVGLYVPGGSASYPSSVLMTAIPAALAGVSEIAMVTPGAVPETLAAAEIAGVHRVFELGGAQAVAALAYGTATVPRVDKIVGPGNRWVAAAKRLVFGDVDIDSIAGPSEVLVIADRSANPAWVAADLLAQAEHDAVAQPILVATDPAIVDAVEAELAAQLAALPRRDIAAAALGEHGAAVIVDSTEAALALADDYAPEHLEICAADAEALARRVRRAGAVFVGAFSPEAAGDYLAGPNHVLPTGGAARYASPLGVYDFQKRISILRYKREDLAAMRDDIITLAEVEGLGAHARSAAIRFAAADQDDAGGDRGG